MKYEKLVAMHKTSHIFWNGGLYYDDFEVKKEYTIFDYLEYQPGVWGQKIFDVLEWLYDHRKRWIIASNGQKETGVNKE
jgi:hypothetical protein